MQSPALDIDRFDLISLLAACTLQSVIAENTMGPWVIMMFVRVAVLNERYGGNLSSCSELLSQIRSSMDWALAVYRTAVLVHERMYGWREKHWNPNLHHQKASWRS